MTARKVNIRRRTARAQTKWRLLPSARALRRLVTQISYKNAISLDGSALEAAVNNRSVDANALPRRLIYARAHFPHFRAPPRADRSAVPKIADRALITRN